MQPPPETIRKLIAKLKIKKQAEEEFIKTYGHGRTPVSLQVGGKMVIAIGGTIARQVRDGPYDYRNVYVDTALDLFGQERVESEMAKDASERHPAVQFLSEALAQQEADKATGEYNKTGSLSAWSKLGYDLFTVRDNAQLMEKLRGELLDSNEYQSARCELRACAIAVTAGFEIEFEDESDIAQRHVEFVGVDRVNKADRISVEAKSRRRRNVLGFKSGKDEPPGTTVGYRNLMEDALTKPHHPLYVFIDLNLPPGTAKDRTRWIAEIEQTMSDLDAEGYLKGSLLHGVLFFNDPSHYVGPRFFNAETDSAWVYSFSTRALNDGKGDVMDRLIHAFRQRTNPPSTGP